LLRIKRNCCYTNKNPQETPSSAPTWPIVVPLQKLGL
jgi:hypothetical protein